MDSKYAYSRHSPSATLETAIDRLQLPFPFLMGRPWLSILTTGRRRFSILLEMDVFGFRIRRVFGYVGDIALKSSHGTESCSQICLVFAKFPKPEIS